MRSFLSILIFQALAGLCHSAAGDRSPTGFASVKSEQAAVHAEMSTGSTVVMNLAAGQDVVVKLQMLGPGSDGPWCRISLQEEARSVGYVQCKHLERNEAQEREWRQVGESAVAKAQGTATKVLILGNRVLVPVTLKHSWKSKEVLLLLDTGASNTVIHADVASELNVDLGRAKQSHGMVAGGAIIESWLVRLDRIEVGPHAREGMNVDFIEHEGPRVLYRGLLGMDFLRGLQYDIDFENKTINWNVR